MDLFLQLTLAGLAIGSIYACVALAVVMIYQATDHFNFAQGEMAMFSTFVAWALYQYTGSIWLAFVLAVALSFLAGIVIERVIVKPVESAPVFNQIIVFIGLLMIFNNLAGWFWEHTTKTLPSLFPTDIVNPDGYQIAAVGRPCEEVSGDYYDVIPMTNGRIALVVGDVSGHGLGPSIFMAQTRALIHSLLATHPGPAQVMESLNAFLERDMPVQSFMTLFLAVLDPAARRLEYVSAGHNPPLVVRNGGVVEELKANGPLLGVVAPGNYAVADPVVLEDGDVVLLYTDGIFEAHNPANEIYGEDRLRDSLVKHVGNGSDADDVLNGVLADLLTFCEGRPNDDDVTSLVVRVA